MAYSLLYHPDVLSDDLAKIPGNIKLIIRKAIEEKLLVDPVNFGQPLRQTLKGYRKLRVGDYRVIYKIISNDIIILKIGNRKDVYEKIIKRI